MMKIIYNCSKTIQKSQRLINQMRNNRFYIDDPHISQKKEAQSIVESLYFNKEDKLSKQVEKVQQEDKRLEQLLEQPIEQLNFRKFQTAKELLDFYEAKQINFTREQFVNFFQKLCYCIRNQDKIQQNKLNYFRKLAAKFKAKYNKEFTYPVIVYLTPYQIAEHPIFSTILEDFVTNCEVNDWYQVRKHLSVHFNEHIFQLDYFVLQRLWEESEHQIEGIHYLTLIIRDIDMGKLVKESEQQFLELFEGKYKADQTLKQVLEQFLLEKLQKVQIYQLNNHDLTNFVYTYNWAYKIDILPTFQTDLVEHLKNRVATLNVRQTLKILKVFISLKIGDAQLLSFLLWNVIRLKNKIKEDKLNFNLLLFILAKFKQNMLFIKDKKTLQKSIFIQDFMVFPELFSIVMENLNQYSYIQLVKILGIAFQNYAGKQEFNSIITNIFKFQEINEMVQLNEKIEIFYQATQTGNLELDLSKLLKNKVLQLSTSAVKGFFEKHKEQQEQEIPIEFPYYTAELQHLVKLIWASILQNNKNFDDINYLIFKVNELTALHTIIKIDKKTQKLISQINQFISLFGKNNFPNKIDVEQIRNNSLIVGFRERYPQPKKISTKLFLEEVFYFSLKHQNNIQKNVTYQDLLIDIVYTNPQTGDKAFILLNGPNEYLVSVTGEMLPQNQIAFQDELLQKSRIPVIRINLPEMIKCQQKSYIEYMIQDILVDGSNEYEQQAQKIQEYREMLNNNFNYISTFEITSVQEEEEEDVVQDKKDDVYKLSDEEEDDEENKGRGI